MRNIFCSIFIAASMVFEIGRTAFGHGFGLSLADNQIEAETEVPTISPHLFVETFDAFSSTTLFTDHGGVEADTGSGFNLPSDQLRIEFLGPLWYSSGGPVQLAASGLTLNATSYDSQGMPLGNVNLTGSTNSPGNFAVVGDDDHSIGWILSGDSIPSGAYGFGYRVTGLKDGNLQTPFEPSVPLVVVFNTPDFTGGAAGSLSDAQSAIFNAVLQGDFNRDGKTTAADVNAMLQALADLKSYQTAGDIPDADLLAIADLDRSGGITNADIQPLLDLLASQAGPQPVPEPAGLALGLTALGFLLAWQWQHGSGKS